MSQVTVVGGVRSAAAVAMLVLSAGALGVGCGDGSESDDGGVGSADAAATDGGSADGSVAVDSGATPADAGSPDGGGADPDGGGDPDGGTSDAGATPADGGAGGDAGTGGDSGPGETDGGAEMDAGAMDAGGGADAGMDSGAGGADSGAAAGLPVSVGYYVEDPIDNPEDPTVGTLLIAIPPTDGPFTGQIPFGYVGCDAGTDVAELTGTRSGGTLSGTWSGAVDGTAISGTFSVSRAPALGRWDGTFTTTGGKVMVSFPPCEYYVAGHGTVRIFDSPTNEPPSFVATSTGGATPTFAWPSLGGGVGYVVRVFDVDCVAATPGSPTCFMGEALMLGTTVAYPGGFSGSRGALTPGRTYVTTVTAQRLAGGLEGFSPVVVRP